MKTSLLIYATCFVVTGCSGQLRLPSLSSALSSLTGYGVSAGNGQTGSVSSGSPYSGLVREYGRNLVTAMSSIYPTLFKPQQPQQSNQPTAQSPFEAFGSQFGSQGLMSAQSPSFSFGGSTFSIAPQGLFSSMSAGPPPPQASPFSGSFGSSINSPPSFGSLSSSNPFAGQQFAPASSYNAAFEAANGGPSLGSNSFESLRSSGSLQPAASSLIPQSSNSHSSLYSPIPSFSVPHESASPLGQHSQHGQQAQQHQLNQPSNLGSHPAPSFASPQSSQYSPQHYRPDMMSPANSFSNYGNLPSSLSSQQQVSGSRASSYQQPSFR